MKGPGRVGARVRFQDAAHTRVIDSELLIIPLSSNVYKTWSMSTLEVVDYSLQLSPAIC